MKHKFWVLLGMLVLFSCAEQRTVNGQNNDQVNKKARSLFNKAYDQYSFGEYAEAEKLLKSAIKKEKTFVDAYDLLARTYQAQNRNDLAIATYRQVLTFNSQYFFAIYELGDLYFDKRDFDSAQYFYSYMLKQAKGDDKYVQIAKRQLNNIEFIKVALKNPVPMEPMNLGPKINTDMEEYSPALTIDGSAIFFTWRNGQLNIYQQNEDLFYAKKDENGEWGYATPVGPPINTAENEGAFSITADGKYIFFTSCNRSGGMGQCDIWITSLTDRGWSDPVNLGLPINSKNWESQPCISSDGRTLYFASDRPGGYGKIDLYYCNFTDSGWSRPINLGPEINTPENDQFPFIHSDGVTLYFSSYGHPGMGEADLFVSHRKPDGSFAKPKNLGYPINNHGDDWNLVVARDGKTAFYSSDLLEVGNGGMDLYSFELPKEMRAQRVSYLKGKVFDEKTKARLGATVELIPLDEGQSTNTFASDKTGEFVVALRGNKRYALNVQAKGYLFYSDYFDMPEVPADEPYLLDIPLKKIEVGNAIVLKNVFFDTDKFTLKPESEAELQKLLNFLKKNENLKIEVSGHTDNQGSKEHNKVLSENRAKAVYQYLIDRGIDASRMEFKGYGDSSPIADNSNDEGRAKNRRTEFKIIQ